MQWVEIESYNTPVWQIRLLEPSSLPVWTVFFTYVVCGVLRPLTQWVSLLSLQVGHRSLYVSTASIVWNVTLWLVLRLDCNHFCFLQCHPEVTCLSHRPQYCYGHTMSEKVISTDPLKINYIYIFFNKGCFSVYLWTFHLHLARTLLTEQTVRLHFKSISFFFTAALDSNFKHEQGEWVINWMDKQISSIFPLILPRVHTFCIKTNAPSESVNADTHLLVWLLGAGGHRVRLPQCRERPRPEVCDGRDYRRDGLFGERSVTVAVGAQKAEGTGRWRVRGRGDLVQRLLWNAEQVHGEEDAPGQRWEEVDDLVLGAQELPEHRVTPVHRTHQVAKRSAQTWKTQRQGLKRFYHRCFE